MNVAWHDSHVRIQAKSRHGHSYTRKLQSRYCKRKASDFMEILNKILSFNLAVLSVQLFPVALQSTVAIIKVTKIPTS